MEKQFSRFEELMRMSSDELVAALTPIYDKIAAGHSLTNAEATELMLHKALGDFRLIEALERLEELQKLARLN